MNSALPSHCSEIDGLSYQQIASAMSIPVGNGTLTRFSGRATSSIISCVPFMMAVWVAIRNDPAATHPVCAKCSPSTCEDSLFICVSRMILSLSALSRSKLTQKHVLASEASTRQSDAAYDQPEQNVVDVHRCARLKANSNCTEAYYECTNRR